MATFGKMGTIKLSLRGVPLLSDSNTYLYITRLLPIREAIYCWLR
ncbi:uncharacterized protein CTRU02_203335 [Colletotrichum truncatum]|uniref:Uncharacterized protein n=1 Tax=Colletotrichum truncatum TaxID=5467 RepID=A0ACC3Z912_COLTU|nr:uncharacterized protein CTRU02_05722 [Colletotrichum truncatum]KAF6793467.1 hypothetical protein CTRU02_05722 [Colletotrichum truncatum]